MMTLNRFTLSASLATLTALSACQQRDICFDHDTHALRYALNTTFSYQLIWHEDYSLYDDIDDISLDWLSQMPTVLLENSRAAVPDVPSGVRTIAIKDGKQHSISNLDPLRGTVYLGEGVYSLLFYNNDTESIVFDSDYSSAGSITATTRTRVRSTYLGNPYVSTKAENTVTEPDRLFCYYEDEFLSEKTLDGQAMSVTMTPVVYTYLVACYFDYGSQYVALARGVLAGMAQSVNLSDGSTSDETASVLFDFDIASRAVIAKVNSFGIPDYTPGMGVIDSRGHRTKSDNTYGLTLEVRLTNGNLLTFDFDITDQMELQPNGGVITISGITIPDSEGKKGGSAFNVEVEGWGEYQDVTIPLGNK
jgi:Domain of unknown function (DUF5119)